MPKIVDHAKRRDEIAHVACQVVASRGFEQATVARIARAAGYTTGMVAHYYDSKQDIILGALRLILLRIEERLTRERDSGEANLLSVLSEALAIDAQRFTECAFWMAFWGQVSADQKLKRLNAWVHREYMRLFARCFAEHWPEWSGMAADRARPGAALGGHLHQWPDRGRGDESARLAGAECRSSNWACNSSCCAAGRSPGAQTLRLKSAVPDGLAEGGSQWISRSPMNSS